MLLYSSVSGTFTADEEINQATTGAVGKVVEYDSTNKLLYWYQTRFPDVGTDSNGNATALVVQMQSQDKVQVQLQRLTSSNSSTVNGVV